MTGDLATESEHWTPSNLLVLEFRVQWNYPTVGEGHGYQVVLGK